MSIKCRIIPSHIHITCTPVDGCWDSVAIDHESYFLELIHKASYIRDYNYAQRNPGSLKSWPDCSSLFGVSWSSPSKFWDRSGRLEGLGTPFVRDVEVFGGG